MSYHEALEDKIPMSTGRNGQHVYHPPCRLCGGPAYSWSYNRKAKYTCVKCRDKKAIPGFIRKVCT